MSRLLQSNFDTTNFLILPFLLYPIRTQEALRLYPLSTLWSFSAKTFVELKQGTTRAAHSLERLWCCSLLTLQSISWTAERLFHCHCYSAWLRELSFSSVSGSVFEAFVQVAFKSVFFFSWRLHQYPILLPAFSNFNELNKRGVQFSS